MDQNAALVGVKAVGSALMASAAAARSCYSFARGVRRPETKRSL